MQFDHHIGVQFVKEAFEDDEEVGFFSLGDGNEFCQSLVVWIFSATPTFLFSFTFSEEREEEWGDNEEQNETNSLNLC